MSTLADILLSLTAYPLPRRVVDAIALRRGIDPEAAADPEALLSHPCLLAEADTLVWLSQAPAVSQGGQSYSFTDQQRAAFRTRAASLYRQCDVTPPDDVVKAEYGYKGSRL